MNTFAGNRAHLIDLTVWEGGGSVVQLYWSSVSAVTSDLTTMFQRSEPEKYDHFSMSLFAILNIMYSSRLLSETLKIKIYTI